MRSCELWRGAAHPGAVRCRGRLAKRGGSRAERRDLRRGWSKHRGVRSPGRRSRTGRGPRLCDQVAAELRFAETGRGRMPRSAARPRAIREPGSSRGRGSRYALAARRFGPLEVPTSLAAKHAAGATLRSAALRARPAQGGGGRGGDHSGGSTLCARNGGRGRSST